MRNQILLSIFWVVYGFMCGAMALSNFGSTWIWLIALFFAGANAGFAVCRAMVEAYR